MKVVLINSSRRKKNTFRLLTEIADILKNENIEVEIVNLYDYNIDYCLGCESCLSSSKCFINDDYNIILDKLIKADGIVFASPVYLEQVSGILKVFMDRSCKLFHQPLLAGKVSLVISTTKESGLKNTLNTLESFTKQLGMINCGKISRNIVNIEKEISYSECRKFIKVLNLDKKLHKPKLSLLIN